ncbi:unnamed protein product, partial [Allacma fusca]
LVLLQSVVSWLHRRSRPDVSPRGLIWNQGDSDSSDDETSEPADLVEEVSDGEDDDMVFRKGEDEEPLEYVPHPDPQTYLAPDGTHWTNVVPPDGRRKECMACAKLQQRRFGGPTRSTKINTFVATMSRKRFWALMRFLRYNDFETREERRSTDKLAAIREFLEKLLINIYHIYEPSEYLVVDEMLIPFRGRCFCIVYMTSKPDRYGLKVWALVVVRLNFVLNFQIYTGKEGPAPEVNQGFRVLMDMLNKFLNTGRGVTADNVFGLKRAAERLAEQNTSSVFTIRKQRREVPKDVIQHAKFPLHSSLFLFHDNCMMVSYKAKPNKMVLVMSTQHRRPQVMVNPPKKPAIILHYNSTKGGVDTVDQMISHKFCQRKTNRWPVTIWLHLLNIVGGINTPIMFLEM